MSGGATGWADPQRLAEWFGHGLDADLLIRIGSSLRLASHCVRLIDERLGPVDASAGQREALSLDGLGLMGLAHQAGTIWHARAIVQVIDGPAVRSLVGAIGPGLRSFAIAHAGLAPMSTQPVGVEALPASIASDGLGCLAAWCDAQPSPVGQRLVLRLCVHAAPDNRHRVAGPAIIDALLRRVPADA